MRGDRIDMPDRPPECGYFDPPKELYFADLMRTWVVGVARSLAALERQERRRRNGHAGAGLGSLVLEECWVGGDCALYVRYRHTGHMLGARFTDLDSDLLSGHRIRHDRRDETGGSSTIYAINVYTALDEEITSDHLAWTDALGYRWSGQEVPSNGWRYAVNSLPRLETVLSAE